MMDWALIAVCWTIGGILVLLASVIIGRRMKFKRQAIKGYATITEFRCNPTDFGRRFYPVFEFEIDGETISQESEFGFNPPAGQVGEKIGVLYNPDDLSQAMVPEFTHLWGTGIFIGSVGLSLMVAGILL